MTASMEDWDPLILAVAPNGARKTKADHKRVPITPEELAATARDCHKAGASLLHLHVRDDAERHSLDAGRYREAIAAVREAVGQDLIIQITTEAVGLYDRHQQMNCVRAVEPEAVSLSVRELVPDAEAEEEASHFMAWLDEAGISPQFILYDVEDLRRFNDLTERGIIPARRHFVLFVLGRYSQDMTSHPSELLPFLEANSKAHIWAVCAFGPRECACAAAAAALGGHARVGFENNLHLPSGGTAPDNAALVRAAAAAAKTIGRPLADAATAREMLAFPQDS
ncbi:3-keto-5-aminohexanoate cleavage protein [Fodinicurvata fenggangensis]|uniref:3-keto-5-aminohexanoate cleavage protein n=1 Tax=Fodinicurvata fenggangensis TaxID=1121830 RepID=UPI0004799ECB|nr:3-keto-5-aminohexanoate cleavage protein [Fodinicurvata fenggangensis]